MGVVWGSDESVLPAVDGNKHNLKQKGELTGTEIATAIAPIRKLFTTRKWNFNVPPDSIDQKQLCYLPKT